MKTRFDDELQKQRISEAYTIDGAVPGSESEQLKDGIRNFRESFRVAAERPDTFWARQRVAISEGLQRHPTDKSKWKPALLWAPASIVVLMCLFLFTVKSKLPAPDFAVGADQNLLVDVEQALVRDCPEALAPAAILVHEIK
jgi:hypothetical protein